jgi:hypothetical protein
METPDIQFHFESLSADKSGVKMHPFSGITLSVCQLRPESELERTLNYWQRPETYRKPFIIRPAPARWVAALWLSLMSG